LNSVASSNVLHQQAVRVVISTLVTENPCLRKIYDLLPAPGFNVHDSVNMKRYLAKRELLGCPVITLIACSR
jgi:hypothetical protein